MVMSMGSIALRRRAVLALASSLALPRRADGRAKTAEAPPSNAPVPELAGVYRGQLDPALCLVSEKYDGVRALWDGRELRHRSGRPVAAPRSFLAALPNEPLDGELWLGRGRFEPLSAIVRRSAPSERDWLDVRYMVFDQPLASGTYESRLARLAAVVRTGAAPVELAPQFRVAGPAALDAALARVVDGGGEGLMLHLGSAPHVGGRSVALLKLKPSLDAEARVVGHRTGNGRLRDQLGAIEVESADGRRFWIGSGLGERERREPPPIGSLVTYRYRDLTSGGLPRFATYLRRHDDW
jgi:DNA ligase-1